MVNGEVSRDVATPRSSMFFGFIGCDSRYLDHKMP